MKIVRIPTYGSRYVECIEEEGTHYHIHTADEVIRVLEKVRKESIRISIDYGDTKTGESWGKLFETVGKVGRCTGPIRVPLLLHNIRSTGGDFIYTNNIIEIKTTKEKEILYKLKIHPFKPEN